MRIKLCSIFVRDQAKALKFYTEVLGFVKKTDMPAGKYRWLTVVSSEDPDGTELVLEPNTHQAAKTFQEALVKDGIPATAFAVEDVQMLVMQSGRSAAHTGSAYRGGDTSQGLPGPREGHADQGEREEEMGR